MSKLVFVKISWGSKFCPVGRCPLLMTINEQEKNFRIYSEAFEHKKILFYKTEYTDFLPCNGMHTLRGLHLCRAQLGVIQTQQLIIETN